MLDVYPNELYPHQVDELLAKLNLEPIILDQLEKEIVEKANIDKNAEAQRQEEEKEIIEYDINTLKELVEDKDDIHYIKHPEIRHLIWEIIKQFDSTEE